MFDQIFGLLLFGLGLANPVSQPSVKGENTESAVQLTLPSETSTNGSLIPKVLKNIEKRVKPTEIKRDDDTRSEKRPLLGKVLNDKQEENIKKREDELKSVFEARKERVNEELKTRREEAVEKFKVEREAFKEKVSEIRDMKKKAAVTRIDTKIAEINKKRTEQMTQRLTHMSEILDKVGVRSSEAKAAGKDNTAVDSLATAARAAVVSAQTVVSAQAGKVYIADISTVEGVGDAMSTAIQSLRTDLVAVHEVIKPHILRYK